MNATPTILFENKEFLVVDKPAGWLSVPGRFSEPGSSFSEVPVLGLWLQDVYSQQMYPVHRLDRDVSGLILWARSSLAQRVASQWFQEGLAHKIYQALTIYDEEKKVPLEPVEYIQNLVRGKKRVFEAPHGKKAVTRVTFLGALSGDVSRSDQVWAEWQLEPLTGRSHQLRYLLGSTYAPILGDSLYGSKDSWPCGIALRSIALDLSLISEDQRMGLASFLRTKKISFEGGVHGAK